MTEDRIRRLEVAIESLLSYIGVCNVPLVTVKIIACVVGQVISMQAVLGKIVQLKTRALYRCILSRASWNAPVRVTEEAVSQLRFWRQNLKSMNEKGKEVSPNLDSQICVYSDASNEGYGGYVSYLDSACGNVSVEDRGLYIHVDSMSSYSDALKVNYGLYGNMSGRDTTCSKHVCSGFVTEEDFWQVNDDMSEMNNVHESDTVLESDVAFSPRKGHKCSRFELGFFCYGK